MEKNIFSNFGNSFIKNDIMFMYLLGIYKKPLYSAYLKINTLKELRNQIGKLFLCLPQK